MRSLNPARPSEVVAEGGTVGTADVDAGVAAAADAAASWAATPIHQRGAVLLAAADVVDRNADAWGLELATEEGKTKAEGIGEVRRAAQILRYYGNEGDRQAGEIFASPRAGEQILVTRKPVGVVGVITPFNFPDRDPGVEDRARAGVRQHRGVEARQHRSAAGDSARPGADRTPGCPPVCSTCSSAVRDIGDAIVGHRDIDAITFTGSTGIGRRIAATAAARGVPAQAEMGGKNAAVVLDDADLDLALDQVMLGAFRSTGQKCTATSRLIITDGIADRFLGALTERARALVVGDPTDDTTQMGPVVSESAHRIHLGGHRHCRRAGGNGAGRRQAVHRRSACARATSSRRPSSNWRGRPADIWTEELFGPVLAVKRAADADEAFALANDSEFGLSAAVFTQDLTRALQAVEHIDVGVLHVNSESAGADPHVPFGGAKKSGLGPKEQGGAAREFFTHTTTVYLRGGRPGA